MHAAFLLAATAIGVDYGWQPLDEGGFEYIIQIEPELVDTLLAGEPLRSDLPPQLRDVRSYRIQVGRGQVPRLGNPQAAVTRTPASTPQQEPAAEPPSPAGDRWSPDGNRYQVPPMQPPRGEPRYPDQLRTGTSPPKLPAEASPPQPVDDTPRPFQPDPGSTAIVQQLSYGTAEAKEAPVKVEEGPSAAKAPPVETTKPWLPLTFTLLCLFVSLGGNAYLGMQWWTIRLRCQQLLRDRRIGRGPQGAPAVIDETDQELSDEQDADDEEEESEEDEEESDEDEEESEDDEEDQDVRAITEEELPRGKHRRTGSL